MSNHYIPGCGSVTPKLLICGEAPGKYEDEQGIPFVGPTGRMLDEYLFKAGIKRSDCYITNVVKYRPPMNDIKKLHLIGVDLAASIEELWSNEINKLHPNCILAIGDLALQAVCGISGILNYRGSILAARDGVTKCVPTIHPAALFSRSATDEEDSKGGLSWVYTKLIEADIIRAAEESASPIINLPERTLTVAHNSLDVHRFFREYSHLDKAAVDIESINCVPVCVGFAFNKQHAISIPLLRHIGNNNLTDMGDNELDECWRMIDEQLRKKLIIGHNFMYDEYKLGLIGFECPTVYSDTLIKTRVLFPELPDKRLCVVSSLWTREPYYKDDGKEFKLGKGKIDSLLIYNARDCAVEFEVDKEQEKDLDEMSERFSVPLRSYYYDYMMKKHKFYLKLQTTGKRVDAERQKELKAKYTEMERVVHEKLVSAIGDDINVKSYPQMFNLLYKIMKFKVRKRDPTSEDSIVALLGSCKKKEQKEILNNVLEERRIRDQKSRQISFSPDYDGRCKSAYNISATETCRSSTGILKKPLRPKKIGLADHTISAHGRLAKDIKSMFIADKGKVIIQVDASQAEARIVAVLAEDWELLEAFDTVDVHRRTAGLMFGYTSKLELSKDYKNPILDNLPKDGPERFTGKAQPLHSKILTPKGWKLMGDIKVGDEICDNLGKICNVTGVFPQGRKDVYRIKLSDGSEVESCKEHIWPIQAIWTRQRSYYENKKLEEILDSKLFNTRGNPKYSIIRNSPMLFDYQDVPLDPYILGLLIGDGSFTTPYHCSLFSADEEIIQELIMRIGYENLSSNDDKNINISGVRPILDRLELGGKLSYHKFVPDIYKFNTVEIRLEILRGLLDTDGTIQEFGNSLEFSTSSDRLAQDVIDIVRSLGGVASITNRIPKYKYKGEILEGEKSNRVFINIRHMNPFKLSRKAIRWDRWNAKTKYNLARNIISIEKSGEFECQCISVSSENQLYITNNFLPTHNTIRHAGNYDMKKHRLMTEFNTNAQKYEINMDISEWRAGQLIDLFHSASPKIRGKFHADIKSAIDSSRVLIDTHGGVRIFNERMDDSLYQEAYANLPQRGVAHLVQGAALAIDDELNGDSEVLWAEEKHDALYLQAPENDWEKYAKLMKKHMETPIDFSTYCTLKRDVRLIIPCDIEVSHTNYANFEKVKL